MEFDTCHISRFTLVMINSGERRFDREFLSRVSQVPWRGVKSLSNFYTWQLFLIFLLRRDGEKKKNTTLMSFSISERDFNTNLSL